MHVRDLDLAPSARPPIVAIATAPGRGGIGVVRLSGADLGIVLDAVLSPAVRAGLRPRTARYAQFLDVVGRTIDDGLVLWFPAPASYTGETVVELQGHGGPVVLRMLLARCLEAGRSIGLRLARPGEFTERAFLEGRLDLAQAEAVADLIDAGGAAAARAAQRAMAGAFSQRVHAIVEPLLHLRALVEATLDFPEEEIDFLQAADATGRLTQVQADLDDVLRLSRQGQVLRDGITAVLVGAPNVGKSSLLNRLAGAEVAIVTPVAGTTRDRIRQGIEIDGVPLHVVDTAGIRPAAEWAHIDAVERIGIGRTLEEVAQADVVVHVVDASLREGSAAAAVQARARDADVLAQVRQRLTPKVPMLTVLNKIDVLGAVEVIGTAMPTGTTAGAAFDRSSGTTAAIGSSAEPPAVKAADGEPEAAMAALITLPTSALTGSGIEALRSALLQAAGLDGGALAGETVFLARQRHLDALHRASAHLAQAQRHAHTLPVAPLELFAEELRLAAQAMGEITGEVTADDLLGRIFSHFCIGK